VPCPQRRLVRVGHSPDPDDAFMFYGIATGRLDPGPFEIQQVLEDIEGLNRRALHGELELTAASAHAVPYVADRYELLDCGASFGDGYGPLLVGRKGADGDKLFHETIAVPGLWTSACLALKLWAGRELDLEVVAFDRIPEEVARGRVGAGVLIHEAQLTFETFGLEAVVDLGSWWARTHDGLPLPLGVNLVRRDLGEDGVLLGRLLRQSIAYSLEHREQALDYALRFGRGIGRELADTFVSRYVNRSSLELGERGRLAIRTFLEEGARAGFVPAASRLDVLVP